MPIITISRGTMSGGRSTAECLSRALGYPCIGLEILQEAASKVGISVEDLTGKLESPPALFARLTQERKRYLLALQTALVSASDLFDSRRKGGAAIIVQRACFEGVLQVTRGDALRAALLDGIGPAKAFGCGLLSLARV